MKIRAIPKVTLIGLNERLVNDKMIINNSYILLTVCCIAAMESALFILINFYNNPIAAAAAAKSLQSCPTLCDPIDGSHQAPLSLGFSRQEHWSGLPFPSPMHESEK